MLKQLFKTIKFINEQHIYRLVVFVKKLSLTVYGALEPLYKRFQCDFSCVSTAAVCVKLKLAV